MKQIITGMMAAVIFLALLAYTRGGTGLLLTGLYNGGQIIWQVLPLILIAFAVAGLLQTVISKETVSKWLGKESGIKGIFLGALAGALVPGGPYVFFPLAATFLVSGAEIGTVIAFLAAKNLWTLSRLPIEIALLGSHITLVRYAVTFIFPVLLGVLANVLFSHRVEAIREQIQKLQKVEKAS
ncbi:MAG: permease [Peptococcaceae bacterium]|nr:permease [Peptococcaceae bacterium]